ncbi:hypothetical protein [Campylobacter geochelonis]|uniref:Uncharacterized protein n=1 Tax=Campylobacter geochelonis TaxID=1780362 RepID=A0A128EIS4_9BACT|nr:hypothetical protein [Campylobacter geochelonis]QKF71359.1 hypothetical protein CGEO_1047 [Campylobacter geochelonis]CZE47967.1 Uncharacterised protein [Campylobacter geochelonis]CZE48272.1 Uncharacterised protein [Campylobacter geochelonis]
MTQNSMNARTLKNKLNLSSKIEQEVANLQSQISKLLAKKTKLDDEIYNLVIAAKKSKIEYKEMASV